MASKFRLIHGKHVQRLYGAPPRMVWDGAQKVEQYPLQQYGAQVEVVDKETKGRKMVQTAPGGDIVESDEPLDQMFPNKFLRIEDNPSHLPGSLSQNQRVEELRRRLAEEEAKLSIEPAVEEIRDLERLLQQKKDAITGRLGPKPAASSVKHPTKPFEQMSLKELQEYAADEEIDLLGCEEVAEVRERCRQALVG